jgi:non-reducing end alpha-L-arabinofuranosidase
MRAPLSMFLALPMLLGCTPDRGGRSGSGGNAGPDGSAASGTGGDPTPNGSGGGTSTGGQTGQGGSVVASGGSTGTGGTSLGAGGSGGGPGGSTGAGGTTTGAGGTAATGGTLGTAGATGRAGAPGSGGSTGGITAPCDIYQAANTPCVAAHSTVRALYGSYSGPLYQLRRASDKTTKDVPVAGAGGFVDISVQTSFCSGTTCTISIIYDQSPNHNDLAKSPGGETWLPNGGNEANAADGMITVGGHTAHGIYVNNPTANVGYRNNATKGVAKGDDPEAMYAVFDAKRFSTICCFDYGNVETDGKDDGNATMEAIYWGASTQWSRGGGNGPWVAADLENGMFEGDSTNASTNTSVTGMSYVTAMLKGPSGNAFGLKAGNAQSGMLETKWNGKRPPGYSPMKKQGAIVLGTGGDGSNYGQGTFYEGAITTGNPADSVDDAIAANIVAAGYGK